MAPQTESSPPMTAPAKARKVKRVRSKGAIPPKAGPSSAAATPANAQPATHANRYTWFTGTPSTRATVGSLVVARTASPNLVRVKKR